MQCSQTWLRRHSRGMDSEADGQPSRELGVTSFDGYFPSWCGRVTPAFRPLKTRRPHAQATSGDVQSGSGITPDRKRSKRRAAELSFVLRFDRAIPDACPPSAEISGDAPLHGLWKNCAVHRGSGLTGNLSADVSRSARSRLEGRGRLFLHHAKTQHDVVQFTARVREPAYRREQVAGSNTVSPSGGRGTSVWHVSLAP
jgi:hypothetical protein